MKVVGISACPAGLAHTPMAAKALEKAGKKIGFDVKMEQHQRGLPDPRPHYRPWR